jgi:hypothetical protein
MGIEKTSRRLAVTVNRKKVAGPRGTWPWLAAMPIVRSRSRRRETPPATRGSIAPAALTRSLQEYIHAAATRRTRADRVVAIVTRPRHPVCLQATLRPGRVAVVRA